MPQADETDRGVRALESLPKQHLTVLFTDLSDSTALSNVMEPEVNAELIADTRRVFEQAVAARDGTVNQHQGDGFQALFGNPQATEEDGQRAAEVALEVHAKVRELREKYARHGAPRLSVHSGIHAGLVLAHPGDHIAGRYMLYGPAPGIAKHLSDSAEADEILASAETLGPRSALFHTEALKLSVKGRPGPFEVLRILSRSGLRTRFEAHVQRGLVPFVGREAELQWLDRALESVRAGRPRFVAVTAPPGVGKTRLAEEFLQRAATRDCIVSRGYCERELSAEPLQPFLQMLRLRFGLLSQPTPAAAVRAVDEGLARIDPALRTHRAALLQALALPLPAHDDGSEPPRQTPEQIIGAVCALVAAVARERRVIVFIDDWQWADQATREVVFGIGRLRESPVLVLAATRPMDRADAHLSDADVLELAVFSAPEADATISRLLPGAHPFVTEAIRRHAGGNPLFLEELCHSAASTADAPGSLSAAPGGSVWLETLIASRVTRLPPEQNELLGAAAVIGNVIPTWLLEALTGCGPDHPTVRALAEQDFIFPGERRGTLRFKHGITREVVYASIGLHRRRGMHQRIAALLHDRAQAGTDTEAVEALAYHHGGAANHAQAAHYAAMAGDKAMAASSIDRAKAHYRSALELLDREPDTPQRYLTWRAIARRLGLACVFDPTRNELAVFTRAIALARQHGDASGAAYAEYWLAYITYALGESRAAVAHCETAMAAARELRDAKLIAQVSVTLGQSLAAACDYGSALALIDEATSPRAINAASGRPGASVAYSLACKASVLGDQGRFDDALACAELGLRHAPWPGHEVEGSVLCWFSGVLLWQGRWEDALDTAQRAQRVAERVKSLYLFGMGRALGAFAAWRIGGQDDDVRALSEAAAWLEARDKRLFISMAYGWLAEASHECGRDEADVRHHAARALQRARNRDWLGAAMARRALALSAAARGDWPAAQHQLQGAARVARLRQSPHEAACNELCAAQVALARGDRETALAAVERASVGFMALQMRWHLGRAERLRDQLTSEP